MRTFDCLDQFIFQNIHKLDGAAAWQRLFALIGHDSRALEGINWHQALTVAAYADNVHCVRMLLELKLARPTKSTITYCISQNSLASLRCVLLFVRLTFKATNFVRFLRRYVVGVCVRHDNAEALDMLVTEMGLQESQMIRVVSSSLCIGDNITAYLAKKRLRGLPDA